MKTTLSFPPFAAMAKATSLVDSLVCGAPLASEAYDVYRRSTAVYRRTTAAMGRAKPVQVTVAATSTQDFVIENGSSKVSHVG